MLPVASQLHSAVLIIRQLVVALSYVYYQSSLARTHIYYVPILPYRYFLLYMHTTQVVIYIMINFMIYEQQK